MKGIKHIETVYNGYRFRSRLEARWAVFFDAMGIKYEYEPEGYILKDGSRYLPDFLIYVRHRSETDEWEPIYVEVKGIMSPYDEKRIKQFPAPLLILGNLPADCDEYQKKWVEDWRFHSYAFMDGDNYCAYFSKFNGVPWIAGWDHWPEFDQGESMDRALIKARQARFEHGEMPNVYE